MVTIVTGTTTKPVSSERLKELFKTNSNYEGYLYIGYPIIGTSAGPFPIDALWVSPKSGLVAFDLIEGKDAGDYQDRQDEIYNKLQSKLIGYQSLTRRRKLMVEINVVSFAPAVYQTMSSSDGYPLCGERELFAVLNSITWSETEYYEQLLSVLQAISTIRQGKKKRVVSNPDSRGAKLRALEDSIANLDSQQSQAVIETVEGVQRIRGLAGSGKTIVLALKAAYLHIQHPEWRIAVTFNTRSLKGQYKRLIEIFYLEQTNEPLDDNNLDIIHAWGAPGSKEKNGVYFSYCLSQGIEYLDYYSACQRFGRENAFGDACKKALHDSMKTVELYDAILVDEAQDFSPDFLRLCYEVLSEPKRLVYAYDELQNLGSQSLPAPEQIFGKDQNGRPKVEFDGNVSEDSHQDIILEKCYRNSRPTLVAAHALGFGIYRTPNKSDKTSLVQMFELSSLWNDIGYEVTEGELVDGHHVVLERSNNTSPRFLEDHSAIDDLIVFKKFDTIEDQNQWVADEIEKNIRNDELRYDDIIVINPDPFTTKKNAGQIRSILYSKGIQSHTAGVDTSPDIFFTMENDSIAFTGIYRAKGNEAAMVYVINAEHCYYSYNELAKVRNRLFTAMTRSKAWVRVLGVGNEMQKLIDEYMCVRQNHFKLDFIYPTAAERKYLRIINRDMSRSQKQSVSKANQGVGAILSAIDRGDIYLEDLNQDQIKRLRELLFQEE